MTSHNHVKEAIEKVQGEIWMRTQIKYLKYTLALVVIYSLIKIIN